MNIFSIDGAFFRIGTKVFDVFMLGVLWWFIALFGLFIPLGATTTAAYYVMDKSIIHDRGYILKNFFKSLKTNFIKGTIIYVILSLLGGVLFINLRVFNDAANVHVVFVAIQYLLLMEVVFVSIYIYPILAKLEMSIKELFKNALLLAHKHIFTTILCALSVGVVAFLVYFVNMMWIFPGSLGAMFIISKLVVGRVMPNYISKDELEKFSY